MLRLLPAMQGRTEGVAQTCSLPYRRIVFCEPLELRGSPLLPAPSRLQVGDTADCKSALLQCALPARGFWYPPTFLTGVTASHRVAQEEIFGPVLAVMTFRTPEEAFERANNTPYGLSAGVWTDKGSKIFKMVGRLRAGVVWGNTFNKFDPTSPFGGYKESGFGREGGLHGLHAYLKLN